MPSFLRKLKQSFTGETWNTDLVRSGVRGAAVVQGIEETDELVGWSSSGEEGVGRTVFELSLLVTVPGREPYEMVHRQDFDAPLGTEVVVYVDPQNPQSIFIDLEASEASVRKALVTQQMAGVDMPPPAGASPQEVWDWQLRNGYITQDQHDSFRKNNPGA